jgi:hypothetical protein
MHISAWNHGRPSAQTQLWRPRLMLRAAAAFVSARQQRPARAFGVKQHASGKSAPEFPQIIDRTEILEHALRGADARANALESRARRASSQRAQYTLRAAAETISRNNLKL